MPPKHGQNLGKCCPDMGKSKSALGKSKSALGKCRPNMGKTWANAAQTWAKVNWPRAKVNSPWSHVAIRAAIQPSQSHLGSRWRGLGYRSWRRGGRGSRWTSWRSLRSGQISGCGACGGRGSGMPALRTVAGSYSCNEPLAVHLNESSSASGDSVLKQPLAVCLLPAVASNVLLTSLWRFADCLP